MFKRKKPPRPQTYMVIDFRDQQSALREVRRIEQFLSTHQGVGHRVGVYAHDGRQTLACSCGMGGSEQNVTSADVPVVLREEDIDYDETRSYAAVLPEFRSTRPGARQRPTDGFTLAGSVRHNGLNLAAPEVPAGRTRHRYGNGPFARLVMPALPNSPGMYLWELDGQVVYAGETRTPLKQRLGSNGYATISCYNTLAREAGRRNGGQQTNCRVNSLANECLSRGGNLVIWYRVTPSSETKAAESAWMRQYGMPAWNRRLEA
jgi:hypothetical protein